MSKLELFDWLGAAWCLFWGVRSTLALTRMRKLRPPPPSRVVYFTVGIALLQAVALAMFLSAALWMYTARDLGL